MTQITTDPESGVQYDPAKGIADDPDAVVMEANVEYRASVVRVRMHIATRSNLNRKANYVYDRKAETLTLPAGQYGSDLANEAAWRELSARGFKVGAFKDLHVPLAAAFGFRPGS